MTDHDFNTAVRRSGIGSCSGLPRLEHYVTVRRHASSAPFPETFADRLHRSRLRMRAALRRIDWRTAAAVVAIVVGIAVLAHIGDGTHVLTGGPQ